MIAAGQMLSSDFARLWSHRMGYRPDQRFSWSEGSRFVAQGLPCAAVLTFQRQRIHRVHQGTLHRVGVCAAVFAAGTGERNGLHKGGECWSSQWFAMPYSAKPRML